MNTRIKKYGEDVICSALLLALVFVALSPVLFQDKLPFNADALLATSPWQEAVSLRDTSSVPLDDALLVYYPAYRFLHDTVERGDSLFWNPLEFGGVPFFAAWYSRCLSPFSIPFYLFSFATALKVSMFLKLLVAAGTSYYATRRLGLTPPFALMSAVAYTLSAHFSLLLVYPVSDVLPWFPLLFVFAERLALGQRHYWPGGALAVGLMLLGGDPRAFFGAVLFSFAYLVFRLYSRRSVIGFVGPLLLFAMTLVVGGALGGIQILPFIEFANLATATNTAPSSAPLALVHLGMVQVFLAGLWIAMRHCIASEHRRRVDCMLAASLFMLLLALPFGRILALVPLLQLLGTQHLLAGTAFAVAIAGAATGEAWLEFNPEQCKSVLKRMGIVVPILLLPALLLDLLPFRPVGSGISGDMPHLLFTGTIAFLFSAILGVTLVRPSLRFMGYGLAVVTFIELLISFGPLKQFNDRDLLYPETPLIQTLSDSTTAIGGGEGLGAMPLMGNGVRQVYGTGPLKLSNYATFLEALENDPGLLSRLGSAHVFLDKRDLSGAFSERREQLSLQQVFPNAMAYFTLPGTLSRVSLHHVSRFSTVGNELPSSKLPPLTNDDLALPQSVSSALGNATIESESNTAVRVNVDLGSPALLVLWDTWYPGWVARVGDSLTEPLLVDGAFRGVLVPATTREVLFYYRPQALRIGVGTSLIASFILCVGWLNLLIHQRRARLR